MRTKEVRSGRRAMSRRFETGSFHRKDTDDPREPLNGHDFLE
jgi:hypothetical protein